MAGRAGGLRFSVLPGELAVSRLGPGEDIPAWAVAGPFTSVTRTPDELSLVCPATQVPAGVRTEGGWALLRLHGPIPFEAVGILRSILDPLAEAGIGILAFGTFDTDYILVKQAQLPRALRALAAAGHRLADR